MNVAQKIEIKASNKFKTYCRQAFGVYRVAYNYCVERFTSDHKAYCEAMREYDRELKVYRQSPLHHTEAPLKPVLPNCYDYKKDFNAIRKKQYAFTYNVTKYASQQAFINFGRAVKTYFENSKNGNRRNSIKKHKQKGRTRKINPYFPKFKCKSYTRGSFYLGGDQVKVAVGASCSKKLINKSNKQYLHIPLFGYVQLKERLKYEGHINSVTISQCGDKFYASFSIIITDEEYDKHHKKPVQHGTAVGIDFGIKSALMLSNGISIEAPKPLKNNLRKLKRFQRQLAKKQHPRTKDDETQKSKNYIKKSKEINRIYRKIVSIRTDFIHKITSVLVNHYEYISLETLNVKGMMANHKLARAISDIGFYRLKQTLKYKAEYKKRHIIECDVFYPSSKTCSHCGYVKKDLRLSERTYICPQCGMRIDRDLNAAINLKNQINVGEAHPDLKPAELTAMLTDFGKRNRFSTKGSLKNHPLRWL